MSNQFKEFCDSVNITQIINTPTRTNLKNPSKSTLIDVILTNKPHKFTHIGIFPDDVSDYCAVAAIRNCKILKVKPRIIKKRCFRNFDVQSFLHDLFASDCDKLVLIPDCELCMAVFPYITFKGHK